MTSRYTTDALPSCGPMRTRYRCTSL